MVFCSFWKIRAVHKKILTLSLVSSAGATKNKKNNPEGYKWKNREGSFFWMNFFHKLFFLFDPENFFFRFLTIFFPFKFME